MSREDQPRKSDLARSIEDLFPETEEEENVDPIAVASPSEPESQPEPESPLEPQSHSDADPSTVGDAKDDAAEAVSQTLREVTALYAVAAAEERTSLVDPLLAASESARRIGAFDTLAEAVNGLLIRDDSVAGELLDDDVRASMAGLLGRIRD